MTPDRIEREIVIEAPVARVWELVTQAEHLGAWFADSGATVDLRPGGLMELTWEHHGTSVCRIERVEPERLLSWRWNPLVADRPGAPSDDDSTLVEMTLEPEGDATRLRVVETGFATLPISQERRDEARRDNTDGWRIELGELEAYAREQAAA